VLGGVAPSEITLVQTVVRKGDGKEAPGPPITSLDLTYTQGAVSLRILPLPLLLTLSPDPWKLWSTCQLSMQSDQRRVQGHTAVLRPPRIDSSKGQSENIRTHKGKTPQHHHHHPQNKSKNAQETSNLHTKGKGPQMKRR